MSKLCFFMVLLTATAAWAVEFRHPVVGDAVVTAYFDHGGRRDWNCQGHTYGGHRGTDVGIIGRFAAQDAGRDVVAAAPGRVTRTHDGEFDRCETADCPGGGGFGNYVVVEHDDGKVSYYAHLRRGSVAVRQGDRVRCGQRLGQVGSSGFSTGPHLHFEVRVGGAADDPFRGECGGPQSWWVNQRGYRQLPVSECEVDEPPPPPPPPMKPDMHLGASLSTPERACDFDGCANFIRDGRSAENKDAWVGETVVARFVVHNRGNGSTAAEAPEDAAIQVDYRVPEGLRVERYLVESDWPAKDRESWGRNDAMDNEANPPEDEPDARGQTLRLNGFSAGEAKRVSLWLRAESPTIYAGDAEIRFWVRHLRDYYGEKTGWNDAVETNDGQSFNGGDLKIARRLDVFDPTGWRFDAPDVAQLEGWRRCDPESVGPLALLDGTLRAEISGGTPCLEGPRVAVPLDALPGARLSADSDGWLQWTTEEAPQFDEGRRVRVERGDTHVGPGWMGTLTRVRWVPETTADAVHLDMLHLAADAPPPSEPDAAGPAPAPDPDAGAPRAPGATDAGEEGGFTPFVPGDAPPVGVRADAGPKADDAQFDGGCRPTDSPASFWLVLLLFGVRRRR